MLPHRTLKSLKYASVWKFAGKHEQLFHMDSNNNLISAGRAAGLHVEVPACLKIPHLHKGHVQSFNHAS